METQAVFEQFALLTGLGEQEAGKYRPLCENARAQVMGIAKPDIGTAGELVLCSAAAALAFYRWTLLRAAAGAENGFAVGDVRDQTCGGCGHGPDAVAGVRGRRRALSQRHPICI